MPIPSRAIPTPAPRRTQTQPHATRPGSSIPRRGLHFMDHADLYDLPLPSSVPVKGLSGVRMVTEKPQQRIVEGKKSEVGIGELVMDGLGRREKRSTSLGFDFIPNPSIMALPEYPTSAVNAKSKLSISNTTSLSATPTTPALVPTQPQEEEDDDDWDHITEFQENKGTAMNKGDENEDDGDIIVLGDIELEEEVVVDESKMKGKAGKGKMSRKDKTYAAVVGTA